MANAQELDKIRRLEEELKKGNAEAASRIIEEILNAGNGTDAKPKTVGEPDNEVKTKKLRVCIGLENWQVNNQARIHLFLEPTATIGDIRKTLDERYEIKSELQIIFQDQRILEDEQTLAEVGVLQDGQVLVVYVNQHIHDNEELVSDEIKGEFAPKTGAKENELQKHVLTAAITQPGNSGHVELNLPTPAQPKRVPPTAVNLLASTSKAQPLPEFVAETFQGLKNKSAVNPGQVFTTNNVKQSVLQQRPASPVNSGWQCTECTLINLPYRPGCELCSTARPEDYRIPENYAATDAERAWCDQEQDVDPDVAFLQENAVRPQHQQIAQELLEADDIPLLYNDEEFDCKICFTTVEVGNGARLRNCLHEFCVDCLRGHIQACQDAVVKCPFADDVYKCDEIIEDREIGKLVDQEAFEKYKQRGLQQAEAAAPNSFHCQTANCKGWCIVEQANFFRCDLCKAHNCLLCKAIHTGMNCKQYQDDLRNRAANDLAARATQDLLDREILEGNAMRCPQCNIIIQKKIGCDWLQCSMCKCEICWVTKGPRWGPKGNGDLSGGCRCRVGGKMCSPNCGNCH